MKKFTMILIAVILSQSILNSTNLQNINYELLKKNKIQIINNSKLTNMKSYTGIILINKPPHIVWEIISDWEKMTKSVTGLEYYKKIKEDKFEIENIINISQYYNGRIKLLNKKLDYTLEVKIERNQFKQYWHMLNSYEALELQEQKISACIPSPELIGIYGEQYLRGIENNTKTLFYYSPIVEININIPVELEKAFIKHTMMSYLRYVKKYSEKY